MGDMIYNSAKATPPSKLLNAKYGQLLYQDGENWNVLGLVQGMTVAVNYFVDRAIELGETMTLPVSGPKIVMVTARRLLVPSETLLKTINKNADDPYNLAQASLEDLLNANLKIQFELEIVENGETTPVTKSFEIPDAKISSWTVAYDSGSLMVFEDLTLEATDLLMTQ